MHPTVDLVPCRNTLIVLFLCYRYGYEEKRTQSVQPRYNQQHVTIWVTQKVFTLKIHEIIIVSILLITLELDDFLHSGLNAVL